MILRVYGGNSRHSGLCSIRPQSGFMQAQATLKHPVIDGFKVSLQLGLPDTAKTAKVRRDMIRMPVF